MILEKNINKNLKKKILNNYLKISINNKINIY